MKKERGIALNTLILIIVAILVLGGVVTFFAVKGNSEDTDKEKVESIDKVPTINNKNSLEDLNTTKDFKTSLSELNWFYNIDGNDDVWRVKIKTFENNLKGYSNSQIYLSGDVLNPIQTITFNYMLDGNGGNFTIGLYNIDEEEKQEWRDMYKNAYSDFVCEEETYNGYKIITDNKTNEIEVYKFLEGKYSVNINLKKENFEDGLEKYKNYIHNLVDTIQVQKYSVSDFNGTVYLEKYEEDYNTRALYLSSKKTSIADKFELDLSEFSITNFNEGGYTWIDDKEIVYSINAYRKTEYLGFELWLFNKDSKTLNTLLTEVGTEVNDVEIKGIKFKEVKNDFNSFYIYDTEIGSYVIGVPTHLRQGLEEIIKVK